MIEKGFLYRLKNGLVICVKEIEINERKLFESIMENASLKGFATCIVVKGNNVYPVGGYDIFVPLEELIEDNRVLID